MGLKGNDPLKSAVSPLDLDSPFIAISKYHVEDRVFRNCSHSDVYRGLSRARKTDRLPWLSDHARQRCAKANCAAISDEHYQHARQREAEEKHRPVQDIKTQEPAHGRFTREHVGLNFFEQETLSTL